DWSSDVCSSDLATIDDDGCVLLELEGAPGLVVEGATFDDIVHVALRIRRSARPSAAARPHRDRAQAHALRLQPFGDSEADIGLDPLTVIRKYQPKGRAISRSIASMNRSLGVALEYDPEYRYFGGNGDLPWPPSHSAPANSRIGSARRSTARSASRC